MTSDPTPAAPRDSATIIVVRETGAEPEVLLLRRHGRSGFAADAWVFPGGVVDDADRHLDASRWQGIDPAQLTTRFADPAELVLGLHVAAVRETFEEAGLLLARYTDGRAIDLDDPDVQAARRQIADREEHFDFAGWLAAEDLVLDLDRLTYLSRWVTPTAEPRRYDTAFFLARAPADQIVDHDRIETTDQRWLTASDALAAVASGELAMMPPTRTTLTQLAGHADLDAMVAAAESQAEIRPILPHVFVGDDGRYTGIAMPWDDDYPSAAAGR